MFNRFIDENESYLKKKEFYDDNGTFNNFKLEDCIDKMVRSRSFSNQLFLNTKKINTIYTHNNYFICSYLCV